MPDLPISTGGGKEPPFVSETLAWCNERRSERGQQPLERLPLGMPDDPQSCPCGLATGLYVDHKTYGDSKDEAVNPLPLPVKEFVRAFDDLQLPRFVADRYWKEREAW